MAQCTNRYLSLCSIPPALNRDGYAGPNAFIFVPFCGYIFASGATISFPGETVPQVKRRTIGGLSKATPFSKEGCYANGSIA